MGTGLVMGMVPLKCMKLMELTVVRVQCLRLKIVYRRDESICSTK